MSQCTVDTLPLSFDTTCKPIDNSFSSCHVSVAHTDSNGTRVMTTNRVDNHPIYGSGSLQIAKYGDMIRCAGGGSKPGTVYTPLCESLGFLRSCGEGSADYTRCL